MDSETIDLKSYVEISKHRINIIKILGKEMQFPSKIAKELGLRTSEVSRLLRGLRKKGLVNVKNPKAKIGRYYILTDKGKKILKEIEKNYK